MEGVKAIGKQKKAALCRQQKDQRLPGVQREGGRDEQVAHR